MMQGAADPERVRTARVLLTIMAAFVAWQALDAGVAPGAGSPSPWWIALPLALVGCMLAFAWRKKPSLALGYVSMLLAIGALAYANFGLGSFTGTLLAIIGGLFAVAVAFFYVAMPIIIYRRWEWPAEGSAPLLLAAEEAEIPVELAARVQALQAIGFVLCAAGRQADRLISANLAYLMHDGEGVVAIASHVKAKGFTLEKTTMSVSSGPESGLRQGAVDVSGPDPLPHQPGIVAFEFPGRSARELLDIVRRLSARGKRTARRLGAAEFTSIGRRTNDEYLRWLIGRGYLRARAVDGVHRFTLKGALVATLRTLWPGSALLRWRRQRAADAALARSSTGTREHHR